MLDLAIILAANVVLFAFLRLTRPRVMRDAARVAFAESARTWERAGWVPLSYEHSAHKHRLTFRKGSQIEVLEADDA